MNIFPVNTVYTAAKSSSECLCSMATVSISVLYTDLQDYFIAVVTSVQ